MSVLAQRRFGAGLRFGRRQGALLAVPALVVGLFVVVTRPASADAEGHGYGYVWANDASAAIGVPYVPDPTYQSNSTGASNTVTRTGTGTYDVRFPNLGPSGTVLVTAYTGFGSTATHRCKVLHWGASGADTVVAAQCFTAAGVPVDSMFTMTYTFPGSDMTRGGYVWNDQANAPFGQWVTPSRTYQKNSTGRTIKVLHQGTGQYLVRMPGHGHRPKRDLGHMLVVAYGSAGHPAAWCDMQADVSTLTDGEYLVGCWTPDATPVDTNFVMTYVKRGNILFAPGRPFANAFVACTETGGSMPCQTSGSPEDSNPAADSTVSRVGPGEYAIHVPLDINGGTVQVTGWFGGVSPGDEHRGRCHVHFWNSGDGIRVRCVDQGLGVPDPSSFQVSYVR